MKFDDNDFGGYSKQNQNNESINTNNKENGRIDNSETDIGKVGSNNNIEESSFDSASSPIGENQNINDNLSEVKSSDNLSGARNDNSKKLSEMSSSERKEALSSDAVDYSTGNYAGIADRHQADIKDKTKKAMAAEVATKGASTTAKAALITKGVNAAKGFFQMLGGLAKAIGGKIAGAFVTAGNFIAGLFGVSATVGTLMVGGAGLLAVALSGIMVFNMISMNMIQKTDDIGCEPVAFEDEIKGISPLALMVLEEAQKWIDAGTGDSRIVAEGAVAWGKQIASEGKFGYGKAGVSKNLSWCECPICNNCTKSSDFKFTCNPFVGACYAHGGAEELMHTNGKKYRHQVWLNDKNFKGAVGKAWQKIGLCKNLTIDDLEAGDVVIKYSSSGESGHAWIYAGEDKVLESVPSSGPRVVSGAASKLRSYRSEGGESSKNFVMRYVGKGGNFTQYGFVQSMFERVGSTIFSGGQYCSSTDELYEYMNKYIYKPKSKVKKGSVVFCKQNNEYVFTGICDGDGQVIYASKSDGVKSVALDAVIDSLGDVEVEYCYPYEVGIGYKGEEVAGSSSVNYNKNDEDNTSKSQVIVRCWGALKQYGLNDASASAVMGNIQEISKFDYMYSDKGLFPYSNTDASKAFCKEKTGDEYNVEAQVEYMLTTLDSDLTTHSGDESWYDYISDSVVEVKPTHNNWAWWGSSDYTIDKFNDGSDVEELTEVFCRCVERPKNPDIDKRIEYAKAFLSKASELNLATGNAKEAALDEDDGCGDTFRGQGVGADGACKWAKETADNNFYGYIFFDEPYGPECAVCHPHGGANKGWQCIGFVTAAWYHGGGDHDITCNTGGLTGNGVGYNMYGCSPQEAERRLNQLVGNHWKVIYNGGQGIPMSMLEPGDILYHYTPGDFSKDGDEFQHMSMAYYDGQIIDSTSGNSWASNIDVRQNVGWYEKSCIYAFRHVR